jgi:UDP-N-acetylmuramate: L-alanyl-gamma-D-glutamyl-meso-diaminopimelate ligase
VLQKGCWSRQIPLGDKNTWHVEEMTPSGDAFTIYQAGKMIGRVKWSLLGRHNINNALAAVVASVEAGVPAEVAVESLCQFRSVARRLEIKGQIGEITVYDDFAHHPTAIATTLAGLRAKVGESPILAVLDIRSNTMKMGVHQDSLSDSLLLANHVILHKTPQITWDVEQVANAHPNAQVVDSIEPILQWVQQNRHAPLHVLIMSNGGFEGLHQKLLSIL